MSKRDTMVIFESTPTPGDRRQAPDLLRVETGGGKYTVVQAATGAVSILRHGEPWREAVHCGATLALAYDLDEARNEIERLKTELTWTKALVEGKS